MHTNDTAASAPHRNYRPRAWCRDAGISRTKLYELAAEQQPRSVVVGRMRLITESPREWATRIGRAA